MKRLMTMALAGAAVICLSGPVMAQTGTLEARLVNDAGKDTGTASVTSVPDGVLIMVEATGLKPGWHGLHIHGVGNCEDHAEHFKKAGSHLAEAGEKHGFLNAEGPHEGDLPNIWVHKDGTAKVEIYSEELEMKDLTDADGSAVMIHDAPDDYKTDPAGASGERLACGVIQ